MVSTTVLIEGLLGTNNIHMNVYADFRLSILHNILRIRTNRWGQCETTAIYTQIDGQFSKTKISF